jgi:hypothetical protein
LRLKLSTGVRAWLAALPPATVFEQVAPVVEDGLSLTAVRARIKKLQDSVAVLKRVPIPAPDIRQKVQSYVRGLTRPIVSGIASGEALTVQWPTNLHALMARHASVVARPGSCWVLRPQKHPASAPRDLPVTASWPSSGQRPYSWPLARK